MCILSFSLNSYSNSNDVDLKRKMSKMFLWNGFVKIFNILFIFNDYSMSHEDEELIYGD